MSDTKFQHTDFPALSTADIASRYDEQAPSYNASLVFLDRYLSAGALRQRLFAQAQGDVLEVACGTGANLRHLQQNQVKSFIGTDLSSGMLAIARQEAIKQGLNAEFQVMDAQNLTFSNAMFDTVISSLATCTFPDPLKALSEMARVCKPDGRILLVEHGRSRVGFISWLQDRWAHGMYRQHACRWNQDTPALIKASGLRIISAEMRLFGILHAFKLAPV